MFFQGGGVNSICTARVAPEKAVFRPALPLHLLPGLNGTDMGTMSYGEQMRDPRWQRKRLETLSAAGWRCEACEATDRTLNVHHKRYVKGRLAWEYCGAELAVLCEPCHQQAHETRERLMAVLCHAESFPQAGITEDDLATFIANFMLATETGDFDALVDEAGRRSSRVAISGHLAGQLFRGELDDLELCDLTLLLSGPELPRLRAILQEARARLQAEIEVDLNAKPNPS